MKSDGSINTAEGVPPRSLWRDFRHYVLWWMFWTALFSILQPELVEDDFWMHKAIRLAAGLAYGLVLGAVFTAAQNTLNRTRRKPLSWGLAIATALVGKAVSFAILGA